MQFLGYRWEFLHKLSLQFEKILQVSLTSKREVHIVHQTMPIFKVHHILNANIAAATKYPVILEIMVEFQGIVKLKVSWRLMHIKRNVMRSQKPKFEG